MPIDLQTEKGRKSFLKDNLSTLLDGINDTYGQIIFDELLKRIDTTISEFNDEMNQAFNLLKNKEKQRMKAYEVFKNQSEDTEENKNEWEKKLENDEK